MATLNDENALARAKEIQDAASASIAEAVAAADLTDVGARLGAVIAAVSAAQTAVAPLELPASTQQALKFLTTAQKSIPLIARTLGPAPAAPPQTPPVE